MVCQTPLINFLIQLNVLKNHSTRSRCYDDICFNRLMIKGSVLSCRDLAILILVNQKPFHLFLEQQVFFFYRSPPVRLQNYHIRANIRYEESIIFSLCVCLCGVCVSVQLGEQDGRVVRKSAFGSEGPRFDPRQQPLMQLSQRWLKQSHTSS